MMKIGQEVNIKLPFGKVFKSTVLAEPQLINKQTLVLVRGMGLIDVRQVEEIEKEDATK